MPAGRYNAPMRFDFDAVILGAGAAGLMATVHAAERGRRVLLLEKARKPGVKILMSGGTHCNMALGSGGSLALRPEGVQGLLGGDVEHPAGRRRGGPQRGIELHLGQQAS